jgi:hypothetical protein
MKEFTLSERVAGSVRNIAVRAAQCLAPLPYRVTGRGLMGKAYLWWWVKIHYDWSVRVGQWVPSLLGFGPALRRRDAKIRQIIFGETP